MSATNVTLRKPTSADLARVRDLAAAGWGPTDIARILNREGVQATRFAVSRWLDPEKAARHREQTRKWNRRDRADRIKPRLSQLTVDARMARMRIYANAGISAAAIGKFFGVEHGTALTEHEVREALRSNRPPRRWRQEPEEQAA